MCGSFLMMRHCIPEGTGIDALRDTAPERAAPVFMERKKQGRHTLWNSSLCRVTLQR